MDDSKRPEQQTTRLPGQAFVQRSERRTRATLSGIQAAAPLPDEVDPAEEEEGVTLEELSQSYQRMLAEVDSSAAVPQTACAAETPAADHPSALTSQQVALGEAQAHDSHAIGDSSTYSLHASEPQQANESNTHAYPVDDEDAASCPLTPQSIVEAILFVGRRDGAPIPAAEIAGLMRGVDASEVTTCVEQLNQVYAQTNRATRIVADGAGYRIQLAADVSFIRDRFYGRVRQVKLNQAAIDCLALIAYQPGISRDKLEQQRGQPSGSLLSQLIRRQLVEMRRVTQDQKPVQRYYPTNRLLDLTGIESLDDLPQTEDLE